MNLEGRKLENQFLKQIFHVYLFHFYNIFFPLQTSSNNVQDIIESRVEKRTKGVQHDNTKQDTLSNLQNVPIFRMILA